MTGRVTLVGGGPGDPGLLTVAGLDALRSADVVLYDHLAPVASLAECRPGAVLIEVGKIPGARTTSQHRINELLVEHARAGRHVVRFKGGDPFVFGRGGEEVQACAEAGLQVTVVPGVSSAIAGAALAGIPVTHRGLVQAFTVVSGHVPPTHPGSTTDWAALARAGHTIVVLMGVTHLGAICTELIGQGLAPHTPAATIADAAMPGMRVLRGTIATLGEQASAAGITPPAVTVIGEVAALDLPVAAWSSDPPGPSSDTPRRSSAPTRRSSDSPRWSSSSRPDPADADTAETEILRPATPADAAELLVLQRACWSREAIDNDSFLIPALHEELDEVIAWLDDWETWVLRRGPRLIGAVRGQRRGSDWEVGRLMVAPDLTGRGIGRRLLEHIEAQAPEQVTRFVLYTGALSARNIRLYQRAGYAVLTGDDALLPAIPITARLVKPRR